MGWTYVIKNWTSDDFIQEYNGGWNNARDIAEEVAEEYYDADPEDPNLFSAEVGVKSPEGVIEWFKVSAGVSVYFSADPIK